MTMDPPSAVTMIMRAGGDLERVEVEDLIGLVVEVVDIEGTRVEEGEAMGDGGREDLLLHLYTFYLRRGRICIALALVGLLLELGEVLYSLFSILMRRNLYPNAVNLTEKKKRKKKKNFLCLFITSFYFVSPLAT